MADDDRLSRQGFDFRGRPLVSDDDRQVPSPDSSNLKREPTLQVDPSGDDRLSERRAEIYGLACTLASINRPHSGRAAAFDAPNWAPVAEGLLAAGWVSPETLADRVAQARAEGAVEALDSAADELALILAMNDAARQPSLNSLCDWLRGRADRIDPGRDSEGGRGEGSGDT